MSEDNKPKKVKMYRIMPQIKTFAQGTLLKNKVDLYYSLEEDAVETGGEDNGNVFTLQGGPGVINSFPSSGNFVSKGSTLLFTEAAQFRASDGNVYVRLQLVANGKILWVNLLKIPNKLWAFKIRKQQKDLIKEEIANSFEILDPEKV